MPAQILHTVTQFKDTNTWENAASNTFTFTASGASTADNVSAIQAAITAFYNTAAAGANEPMSYYLAGTLSRAAGATVTDFYDVTADLSGVPTGAPLASNVWQLGPNSDTFDLPSACCCMISFRAAYGGAPVKGPSAPIPTPERAIKEGAPATHPGFTRPQSRLRGRCYLGPLNGAASAAAQGPINTFSGEQIVHQLVLDATAQIDSLAGSTGGPDLVVWSRAGGFVNLVTDIFVDGGFAYRRKRANETNTVRVHAWV